MTDIENPFIYNTSDNQVYPLLHAEKLPSNNRYRAVCISCAIIIICLILIGLKITEQI